MSDKAALRRAMEAALVADPDDLATHRAYADLLTEQGEPRGEFIAVQLALEDPALPATERAELARREGALLKAHQRKWLGDHQAVLFPDLEEAEMQPAQDIFGTGHVHLFRRGWLAALHLDNFSAPLAKALARAPAARLLADLSLYNTQPR